jgi:hypothetical protein
MVDFDWRTACFDAEQRYIKEKREVDILNEIIKRMAPYVIESGDWQVVYEDGSWREMTPEELIKDFYNEIYSEQNAQNS